MDIYAARIASGLRSIERSVEEWTPRSSLERFDGSRSVMRWLRYVTYPLQLKRLLAQTNTVDIHHVVDHGYAHLIRALPKSRSVITVHDLIPLLAWRGELGESVRTRPPIFAQYSARHLSKFSKLIAASCHTARDLVRILGVNASQIEVVSPSLSAQFKRCTDPEIQRYRTTHGWNDETFVILTTGIEFYKNHAVVAQVVNRLIERGHPVHLLWTAKTAPSDSPLLKLPSRNVTSQFVAYEDLPLLYSSVNCVLFPSLYEGFGFPVAEALACGTPVVCSDAASLPEVGGECALFASAHDVDRLTQLVEHVMVDDSHCRAIKIQGPRHAAQFSAHQVAQQLNGVYEQVTQSA